jgi:two-component system sensor histidine kinase ChiS
MAKCGVSTVRPVRPGFKYSGFILMIKEQEQKIKEENTNGIKVLIVDDDEVLLNMYMLKFKTAKFDTESALGAETALSKIKSGYKPDVVLFDVVMPKMDGFEFLENIKNKKLLPECLFVVLSNLGQKEDIEKGKKLGINDYIVKANFTPSEVVKRVQALLNGEKPKIIYMEEENNK